ncbi:MAG TPA: LysR family transcriptional regulator [Kofleriaceae bacterium]|jgi:DNA-binding transcriptional LysR family regulator
MKLSQIDLNLLVLFDAVYGSRNLTHASKQLALSQSATSHGLARLRSIVGDPLFVREGKGLAPTAFAHRIARPIRGALGVFERELSRGAAFDPREIRRRVLVGMRDVLEAVWLAPIAKRLRERAPELELMVVRVPPTKIGASLRSGAADLVIDLAVPVSSVVQHEPLATTELVVLARAGRGKPDLDAYAAAGHIRVTDSAERPGLEDHALAARKRVRRIALRCQSVFAAARVVEQTDLLLTMPALFAPLIASRRLKVWPVPFAMPRVPLELYWHRRDDEDDVHRWLREQVLDVVHARRA